MKFVRKMGLFLLPLISTVANAGLLSITENEINQYLSTRLAEKMPLQDSVGFPPLFQLDYHLHNLSTKIGQTEENRVEVNGIVDGILKLKGKKYDVKVQLNLDTLPYYDAEKGALFLKDVRLNNWAISPEKYQDQLTPFISPLASGLASILDRYPVYTLDENQTKEALVKKFGKKIVVEKGVIRLETSIF